MAKKHKPPGPRPRKTVTISIRADLQEMIAIICQRRGIDMYEYLDPLVRPAVLLDYAKVVREMSAELEGKS